MTTLRLALLSLGTALTLFGCSSSTGTDPDFIACEVGQLRIEGDIDGTPVSLSQSTGGSGFAQSGDSGEFWTSDPFADGTRVDLTIDWAPSIVDGRTANVTTATLVMPTQPSTVPFAGQTFVAGTGSMIRIPNQSENVADLQFNLISLTSGTQAHAGTLRGCWRSNNR
jgi:hypothetical protein